MASVTNIVNFIIASYCAGIILTAVYLTVSFLISSYIENDALWATLQEKCCGQPAIWKVCFVLGLFANALLWPSYVKKVIELHNNRMGLNDENHGIW